jgi:hypothetical protein
MFRIFKKKPRNRLSALADVLLAMRDVGFIETTSQMITDSDPSGCVMIITAMSNLDPILGASKNLAKRIPTNNGLPKNIDEMIKMISNVDLSDDDEIKSHRINWFFIASLLSRATQIAEQKQICEDEVAVMWLHLAEGCRYAETTLEHNVLWSDEEKMCFSFWRGAEVSYPLKILMPKYLRKNSKIKEFAKNENIFLFG